MPIETVCPHCQKAYRLKDEAVGKQALCKNPDCRKPFVVTAKPAANGPGVGRPTPPPAKPVKPPPPPKIDAEALAAAALAEEADAGPEDQRKIAMTCPTCEHKWEEPWAKQGKNVLCPDCRARVKVPEQKKSKGPDWRTGQGKPSLAKIDEVEGVVGTVDAKMVSGETLRKTGVVTEDIEPRPRWHYVAGAALAVALLGGVTFGVMSLFESRKENRQAQHMADALADLPDAKDTSLEKNEVPLYRAGLHLAAAEFALRQDTPEKLKEALDHFGQARVELDQAPGSPGRDLMLAELAVAEVGLLGTDEQVAAGVRIPATPQQIKKGRGEGKVSNVIEELRATFSAMRRDDKATESEIRFHAYRRVTAELARRGHPLLTELLVATAFPDSDHPEATSQCLFAALKAGGDPAAIRRQAEQQKAAPNKGTFLQAVFDGLDPPIAAKVIDPPQSTGDVGDRTRQAYAAVAVVKNQFDDGIALGKRSGHPDSQCRALALVAEYAPDPTRAVEEAEAVRKTTEGQKDRIIRDYTLTRLAIQAGRAGKPPEFIDGFVKSIQRAEYKAWAKGEAVRQLLASSTYKGKPAEEALAEVPDNPKDQRVGHAWGRLALARHNGQATGSSDAAGGFDRWGKGTYRPYGLAGLALGLQDRELK